jgi:hypothetical protein
LLARPVLVWDFVLAYFSQSRKRGERERGEREGLEREGFFPDVTLSLEAQEQATCAARPGAVSVRVKVSSSTMVVGRVQEDRGPLS